MMKELKCGLPRWFFDLFGEDWPKSQTGAVRLPSAAADLGHRAGFDHVRTYKGRVVISQPYQADGAKLGAVLTKLASQGIAVRIKGDSPYYPGQTFLIVIWRKEDDELAHEILSKMMNRNPDASDSASPKRQQFT